MSTNDEWDPSKPLDKKEDEDEVQEAARKRARVDYLKAQHDKRRPPEAPPKKKGGISW